MDRITFAREKLKIDFELKDKQMETVQALTDLDCPQHRHGLSAIFGIMWLENSSIKSWSIRLSCPRSVGVDKSWSVPIDYENRQETKIRCDLRKDWKQKPCAIKKLKMKIRDHEIKLETTIRCDQEKRLYEIQCTRWPRNVR